MTKTKIDLLVEYIGNDNYLKANQLLGSVLEDVQAKRVRILKEDNGLDFGDDDTSAFNDDNGGDDSSDNSDNEQGDEEDPSTEQQTEVTDDIVETDSIMDEINDIEVKVNKRLILGLLNKLSELSVVLNNSELDKNDTQFITFDETMNTYKKILQELQNQTTLAVDQKDVLSKIEVLKTKVVDLENDMEQLRQGDSMDQIEGDEENSTEEPADDSGEQGDDTQSNQEGEGEDDSSDASNDEGNDDNDNEKNNENNGEELTL